MFEENSRITRILLIAVIAAVLYFGRRQGGSRNAVAGIGEPVQTKASGGTQLTIDGYNVKISYLYAYDIEALVVSTHNYHGSDLGDQLSPKDLALAWGKVAEYNDRINFHWTQSGRWYHWSTDTYDELIPVGGVDGVSFHSCNNHLIPADDSVRDSVKQIKTGDHIRLNGYLVNVDGTKSNGSTFTWHTSTTREDTGGGACEVIYVTSVTWLP